MRRLPLLWLLTPTLAACSSSVIDDGTLPVPGARPLPTQPQVLIKGPLTGPLLEKKFYKLFPGYNHADNFEASGVYALGNRYYAVFDNRWEIGSVLSALPENSAANTLTGSGSGSSNFEAISYDPNAPGRFYVTVESEAHNGAYYPRVRQYDAALTVQSTLWTDVPFSSANSNKAFEGAAYVRRGTDDYLLGLVEGTGAIKVLNKTSAGWITVATMQVPVTFGDYSDLDIRGTRVVVTSQQDARVWIGALDPTAWRFAGGGAIYLFPTGDAAGNVGAGNYRLYANVEGVSWVNDSTLVCVSDKADATQPSYQQFKEQSIHVFRVPR